MKQSFTYNITHPLHRIGVFPLMKNFIIWVAAILACFGILPAAAQETDAETIRFTVYVPSSEAVTCSIMGIDHPLSDGTNVFELAATTTMCFSPVYPWKFTSVKDKAGEKPSGFYGSDWYLYVDSSTQDEEYYIEIVNINDLRTAQFTLNVDDPSLVSAIMNGYNTAIDLNPGENIVRFQPNVETHLNLSPTNNITPFYSVTLNGTALAPQGLSYGVQLKKDCVIDVTAILPDEERTVTFSFSSGATNSISIMVNDEEVTQFNGSNLVVKLGDKLTIQAKNTYKVNEVSINGIPISFYGIYSFNVMKDTEIHIDAKPYDTISATVIVNAPELISFSNNSQSLDMTAGENIIRLSEANTSIMWTVSPMAILNSVRVNGNEPLPAYLNSYTLAQGDVIAFDLTEKTFDLEAIVWIDDMSGKACSNYLDFNPASDPSTRYTLENGYNIVNFNQAMNPFILGWGGHDSEGQDVSLTGKAYLNGSQMLSTDGENSAFHFVELADGDVIKLFMDKEPIKCNVSFEIAEGVEACVVKDVITTVDNPSEGFECFAGTLVSIIGKDIKVAVDGKEIERVDSEDVATDSTTIKFTVENSDTSVTITDANGMATAIVETAADADIYNLQGMKIGSTASIVNLKPGIYIIGGQKVSVTR